MLVPGKYIEQKYFYRGALQSSKTKGTIVFAGYEQSAVTRVAGRNVILPTKTMVDLAFGSVTGLSVQVP